MSLAMREYQPGRSARRFLIAAKRYSASSLFGCEITEASCSARLPRCTSSVASPPSSRIMFGPCSAPNSKMRCVNSQYSASDSPLYAKTGVPPAAIAAAAWSCVEKMLQDAQRTSAPRVRSVSISTAVWIVMCSEPAMRAPRSGFLSAYSARIAIRAGISDSAIRISLRPQSASDRSATRKSENLESAAFISDLQKDKAPAPFPMRAPLDLAEPDPLHSRGRNAPQQPRILYGSSSFSTSPTACMLARVGNSVQASVVFLKIGDFARRSASEQARMRAQLEAVIAVVSAEIPPESRLVLDAGDGAAVVLIEDPAAALRLGRRALTAGAAGLPLSAGLNHGAVQLAGRKGAEGMTGDGIAVAANIAEFAASARLLASRSFRDALAHAAPGHEAALAPAGTFTDAGLRTHDVFGFEEKALGRRRRRYAAASALVFIAFIGSGLAWRVAHEGSASFVRALNAKYPYVMELVQRVRY